MKLNNEQSSALISSRGDIHIAKKIFYWAQALVLFGLVIGIGMAVLNWCLNLNLFWHSR